MKLNTSLILMTSMISFAAGMGTMRIIGDHWSVHKDIHITVHLTRYTTNGAPIVEVENQ